MKLDAWLRQDHPRASRFRLVERLCQALNEVHDQGEALGALEPARVEVAADLRCDVSAAGEGMPEPGYAAPERREGRPPSTESDVYSAGAIVWEVLVGRPCGELPAPLADVAPDLPQEIASAVMGCLERSPQWRPKDLTYLAQLAAAQQEAGRRKTAPMSGRAPSPPRSARPARTPPARPSRSHWPLLVAGLLVLGAAAGSYWLIRTQAPDEPPRSAARPPGKASPTPVPARVPPLAPSREASPSGRTPLAAATPEATPAPGPTPAPADSGRVPPPGWVPAATPTPAQASAPVPPPLPTPTPVPVSTPVPTPRPTPTPPPAAAVVPAPRVVEVPAAPLEPVVLTAVSPVSVRRPGKVLLDLRGTGLRPDLLVRVMARRDTPRGITVAGQKWVSATLMTALLELDENVKPGAYAIALEDPRGGQLKTQSFTVTK